MFRSIGKSIEKKKKDFTKNISVKENIDRAFARFLDECFPEGKNFKYRVGYNMANSRIVIDTPNKTIANEVTLKVGGFSRLLLEEKIAAQQIIIR